MISDQTTTNLYFEEYDKMHSPLKPKAIVIPTFFCSVLVFFFGNRSVWSNSPPSNLSFQSPLRGFVFHVIFMLDHVNSSKLSHFQIPGEVGSYISHKPQSS
eukprot:TRINITY_DN3273_c0_g1_i2.p1 TRINITY_DN3273_c0_g1~~TRINITY_DN3273_c0_g1_i2.p1  ORF type:complete len:101 (-),score=8.59 TRINITY_DN3273_c0_g1_i2:2599-2901(-)